MGDKVNEAVLYSRVRKRAAEQGWFFMQVENARDRGTPDLYVASWNALGLGFAIWVECKTANTPKSDDHALNGFEIRKGQKKWHREFTDKSGHPSYFLFQVGGGIKARRYLVPGYRILRPSKITERLLKDADVLEKYPVC